MKLPERDPGIFEIFFQWLYTQKLWDNDGNQDDWPDTTDLVQLYVFADMADVPSLQNQALHALHKISELKKEFPFLEMDYVWENTHSTSPLRRLFLDNIIWRSNPDTFDEDADQFSNEIRLEIIKAMNRALAAFINDSPAVPSRPSSRSEIITSAKVRVLGSVPAN